MTKDEINAQIKIIMKAIIKPYNLEHKIEYDTLSEVKIGDEFVFMENPNDFWAIFDKCIEIDDYQCNKNQKRYIGSEHIVVSDIFTRELVKSGQIDDGTKIFKVTKHLD